ncbi:MAG TPA: hypothetical protein VGF34_09900 [Stellaceae bacterium]|jgi:hypothetical protein
MIDDPMVDIVQTRFYERCGYRRFGEIACPPDGATRIFLTKALI